MLAERFRAVRSFTATLAAPLRDEDCVVQSMPDASPTKWHLAHTTWFFETFVLVRALPGYRVFDDAYGFLFNSYYDAVGERHPRPERGLLTRPTLDEVRRYREHVDRAMAELLARPDAHARMAGPGVDVAFATRLGLEHEQQHQELLLTDILHAFSCNPLRPAYRNAAAGERSRREYALRRGARSLVRRLAAARLEAIRRGLHSIGHDPADPSFAFDNECPRHRVFLEPFELATRARHQRRIPRVHRRRRLREARICGSPTVSTRCARGASLRPSIGRSRRREGIAIPVRSAWNATTRPARAGLSRELLRGRCLRALGGRAPAERGRMGNRRRKALRVSGNFVESGHLEPTAWQKADRKGRNRFRRSAVPDVRRRLGMDAEPLRRLSGLSCSGPGRSGNTTANSCAISWFCGEGRA